MRRRFFSQTSLSYMTIEAIEYTTVELPAKIEYSFNGGNIWEEGYSSKVLYLQPGATVSFRNMQDRDLNLNLKSFRIIGSCNLVGNCMSLIPDGKMYNRAFKGLFKDCNGIVSVSKGFLPATTLATDCYSQMFEGCTSLTTAPELPATILADSCYYYMFSGTNVLPDCSNIDFTSSTVVSSGGLQGLFAGTKVTDNDLYNILPINPTTGKYWLPATALDNGCYQYMFNGCTSLTVAPELPATTLSDSCYYGMFYGCTSLTAAPELPATTLSKYCYRNMFRGCSKLNYIKMLATDISASNCLYYWLYSVSGTGTFVKNPAMTSLPTATSSNDYAGIPSGWTVYNDGEETGGNLITFIVGGTEYQAEEGMTWQEFINSEYNTNGFSTFNNSIFKGTYSSGFQIYNDNSGSTPTMSSDTIINGHSYIIVSGGTGN